MNTPNKITLARILLIPFIVFFYLATFIPYGKLVAAIIFVVACFTDFLDGYLARKNNQVTDLGKFFDTIADKVLIMTGMILTVAFPVAGNEPIIKPLWLGIVFIIIMLAREFIVSALRQIAASKGIVLAADKGGKVKALIQDITIALYMFYAFFVVEIYMKHAPVAPDSALGIANAVIGIVLIILLAISAVLTITSGVSYLVRNKKVFASDKAEEVKAIEVKTEEIKVEEVVAPEIADEKEEGAELSAEENAELDTSKKEVKSSKKNSKTSISKKSTATKSTTKKSSAKGSKSGKAATGKTSESKTAVKKTQSRKKQGQK